MRLLLITLLFMIMPAGLQAADKQPSFIFMPAYWYGYHWEQTPESMGKSSKRQAIVTAAWRLPYGLSLGGTLLQNTSHAQDSRVKLSAKGLSVGFVGLENLSAFYTYLHQPELDYDFPSLDAKASYFGGSGSIIDLGLHFGTRWLRFGPRVLLIDVTYRGTSVTSGSETESSLLRDQPWRDRWLEPYLGVWLLL